MPNITYSEQFFLNLAAMVVRYGTIYFVGDGNHYREEAPAIQRCKDAIRIGAIRMYARIDRNNIPRNEFELRQLFVSVELETARRQQEHIAPLDSGFDYAAAQRLLDSKLLDPEPAKELEVEQLEGEKPAARRGRKPQN